MKLRNRPQTEDFDKYSKGDRRVKYPRCFLNAKVSSSKHGTFVDISATTFLEPRGKILLVKKAFKLDLPKSRGR